MMEWETPLMAAHADVCVGAFPHDACGHLKERTDLRVLNVGHGLGIVDGFLRNYAARISQHVVIEPHPDVLKRVDSQDWAGVTFRRETWQEALRDESFGPFDAVRAQRPVTSPCERRGDGVGVKRHMIRATRSER